MPEKNGVKREYSVGEISNLAQDALISKNFIAVLNKDNPLYEFLRIS